LARLIRGFVVGLCGFTAFFFVVAMTVVPMGVTAAFVCAILAALGAVFLAARTLRAPRP
jgi:Flp pilus assembly protein TadB